MRPVVREALWRCFASALLLRGYIHPDEWHQSAEVVAHALGGGASQLPWEFESACAARSVLLPALAAGLPTWATRTRPSLLPLVLRLSLSLLAGSLCAAAAARASSTERSAEETRRSCNAAWPALVLLSRPLSNTLEAAALALVLLAVLPASPSRAAPSRLRLAAAGAAAGFGTFCRFTTPFFVAPVLSLALARSCSSRASAVRAASALAVGFATSCALCVAADAAYYGRLTLSPLNNALYNAQTANLALHGIHPRATHLLINLPLLFGPMLMPAAATARRAWASLRRRRTFRTAIQSREALSVALLFSILLPLLALSAAPHQEPRFLLPMLLPLTALGGPAPAWFNLPLAFAFGALHQGGVLPAAAQVERALRAHSARCGESSNVTVVAWGMYSLPSTLLGTHPGSLSVLDLGSSGDYASHLAARIPDCAATCDAAFAILPGWAESPAGARPLAPPALPHVSMEMLGESVGALRAGMGVRHAFGVSTYQLQCAT